MTYLEDIETILQYKHITIGDQEEIMNIVHQHGNKRYEDGKEYIRTEELGEAEENSYDEGYEEGQAKGNKDGYRQALNDIMMLNKVSLQTRHLIFERLSPNIKDIKGVK